MNFFNRMKARLRKSMPFGSSNDSESFEKQVRRDRWRQFFSFSWLSAWVSRFFRFENPAWAGQLSTFVEPPNRNLLLKDKLNPLYWCVWSVRFLFTWVLSRPILNLGPAIPAMLMTFAVCGVLYSHFAKGESDKRERYKQLLARSYSTENYKVAKIVAEALAEQFPENPGYRFQLAQVEEKLGNKETARAIMQHLALTKEYAPAIVWIIADQYDPSTCLSWSEEKHKEFRQINGFLLARAKGNELVVAKKIFGTYLMNMGAKRDALVYFEELVGDRNPELFLPTATLLAETGNADKSRAYAEQASKYIRLSLASKPGEVPLRIALAQSLELSGDWRESIATLEEGLRIAPDDRLREALANAYCVGADELKAESTRDPVKLIQRFELVHSALRVFPKNMRVLDTIMDLVIETRENKENQVSTLRSTLLSGLSPGPSHFMHGTISLLDGNFDDAIVHLTLAQKSGLDAGGVLNNMAVAMVAKPGSDLNEALEFANAAVKLLPNHPYVRDTRGQVYLKLGKYQEAIGDLEKSLEAPELRKSNYEMLSAAYSGLGQDKMAEEYRRLAAEIDKSKKTE